MLGSLRKNITLQLSLILHQPNDQVPQITVCGAVHYVRYHTEHVNFTVNMFHSCLL